MKLKKYMVLAAVITVLPVMASAQDVGGCEEYRLGNGLTVILMEDSLARDVRGIVAVRAGMADEEEGQTGAATLLKHLMDNGTEKVGALDREKERPLLEEISRLYDTLAMENSARRRAELNRRISEVSAAAARYGNPMEYVRLMRRIGATDVGSEVTWDGSLYWSSFPNESIGKWLELNSERFINPLFRDFQRTLNVVYDEYNRSKLYYSGGLVGLREERDKINSILYKGTPYARPMTGYVEDMERLSPRVVEEYYGKWYAANNMALILAGDFDAEEVRPLLEGTFGRIEKRELPDRVTYPAPDLSGGKEVKEWARQASNISLYFNGVGIDDPDYVPLTMTLDMLTNVSGTGILDSVAQGSEYTFTSKTLVTRRRVEGGIIQLRTIPYIEETLEMRQIRRVKKSIFDKIGRLRNENTMPDRLFNSVKRMFVSAGSETGDGMARRVAEGFVVGENAGRVLNFRQQAKEVTKADVARCVNRYLTDEYLTAIFYLDRRKNRTGELINKVAPTTKENPFNTESAYAAGFATDKVPAVVLTQNDSSANVDMQVGLHATMHYTPNCKDGHFTLSLRYYYGMRDDRLLEYAATLLAGSGISPDIDAYTCRQMFAALGATVHFWIDRNYFYIEVIGEDRYLDQTLALLSERVSKPLMETNMLQAIIGGSYGNRAREWSGWDANGDALYEYVKYDQGSRYIDRLPKDVLLKHKLSDNKRYYEAVYVMTPTMAKVAIENAIGRSVEAFYYGSLPAERVAQSLRAIPKSTFIPNLMKPERKELKEREEKSVMFLNNGETPYSRAYFYIRMDAVPDVASQVRCQAFNSYFAELLKEEMYSQSVDPNAEGGVDIPPYMGGVAYFGGEVETEHARVNDAVDVYMDLLSDLPDSPERFEEVLRTMYSSYLKSDPDMRRQSMSYEAYKQVYPEGFPLDIWLAELGRLTYEDMMDYYRQHIKGKPVTIAIMGDPKKIDLKRLGEKYGKVRRINKDVLFVDSFGKVTLVDDEI